jgi:hypothetical protein
MQYRHRIVLTNKQGQSDEIKTYKSVRIDKSETNGVTSCEIVGEFFKTELPMRYPIDSKVEVYSRPINGTEVKLFDGVITDTPKRLNNQIKTFSFKAVCIIGASQKIKVDKSYTNKTVTYILEDLCRYSPHIQSVNITPYNIVTSLSFDDEFLYDAFQKVCEAIGYTMEAWEGTITFRPRMIKNNPNIIGKRMFKEGTANFNPDPSRLVNHIRVIGGNALSNDFTENFHTNGWSKRYSLKFHPQQASSGAVEVYLDNRRLSVGAMYLSDNDYDCYVDSNGSAIEFPSVPIQGQPLKVVYRYEYPLIFEDEDSQSVMDYGLRMETVRKEHLRDKQAMMEFISNYLDRYSKPLLSGSLTVFENKWDAGEVVRIKIDELALDAELLISGKTLNLEPSKLSVDLSFDAKPDLTAILKDHIVRIRMLEKEKNAPNIERFKRVKERIGITDSISMVIEEEFFIIGENRIGDIIT